MCWRSILSYFNGCVLIVSHDRYFMDKIVDHLFVFEGDGIIKDFHANYSIYRDYKLEKDKIEKALLNEKKIEKAPTTKNKPIEEKQKKLTYKEKNRI